jgi:hypothetical protein
LPTRPLPHLAKSWRRTRESHTRSSGRIELRALEKMRARALEILSQADLKSLNLEKSR